MKPRIPLEEKITIGEVFGRLTVIDGLVYKSGRPHWICRCVCGKQRTVSHYNLLKGWTSSCGCYRLDRIHETLFKHGQSGTPGNRQAATSEWITWNGIKDRCLNPNNSTYPYYGGRGITVCERWRDSFENFYADMGSKPTAKHSIDRRDVNKNYDPDNCRWATPIQQGGNKSNNVNLTYDGETYCVAEWCRRTGLKESLVRKRVRMGWSHERALTTPRGASGNRRG